MDVKVGQDYLLLITCYLLCTTHTTTYYLLLTTYCLLLLLSLFGARLQATASILALSTKTSLSW